MTVFGNQDIWFLCHLWCVSPPDCPVTSGNQTILCWKIPRVVPWISYFNAHSKGISHVWSADTGRSWEEVTPVAHWAAHYEHAAQARAPGDEHCKVVFQWAKSQPQNSNNSLGFMILVTGWWFGTCCPYIGNLIIPTDFHIFQRGWNHQPVVVYIPSQTMYVVVVLSLFWSPLLWWILFLRGNVAVSGTWTCYL